MREIGARREMSEDRSPNLIQSVQRALRVLEEISRDPAGVSAKVLAQRCRLALPTTYHLLRTLAYQGYVLRRPDGAYVLGLKIAGHFHNLLEAMGRPPQVHEVLRQLAGSTGHSAYFGQVVDGSIVFTDLFEGPRSPHVEDLVVGFAEGAHATALGKALLSTLPAPERQQYLREQGLRRFTDNTIVDPQQLAYEVRIASLVRLFIDHGEFRDDVCCASVVIPGEQPVALALTSSQRRWEQASAQLTRHLRMRARDLTAAGPPP